jgi:hypothetical protein
MLALALAAVAAAVAPPPVNARFDYRRVYGNHVIAIEYRRRDFRHTCRTVGDRIWVVLRNVDVTAPGTKGYRYDAC